MELIYTLIFVVIVTLILVGLTQARSTPQQFFRRDYPLESFTNPSAKTAEANLTYSWGQPIPGLPEKKPCSTGSVCQTPSCPVANGSTPLRSCDQCDILKHPDIKYFVLKSSIKPQSDMSEYVRKSEITPPVDLKDYIRKSEIPACPKCPDMSDYVKKSSLPAMPECPKCPTCPVCPVCEPTYTKIEDDPRFKKAICKYVLKEDAQNALNKALKEQAEDLLMNMRCPSDKDQKEVEVKDAEAEKKIKDPRLIPSKQKTIKVQATQEKPIFSALFPENTRENAIYRKELPKHYKLPVEGKKEVVVSDASGSNAGFFGFFKNWLGSSSTTSEEKKTTNGELSLRETTSLSAEGKEVDAQKLGVSISGKMEKGDSREKSISMGNIGGSQFVRKTDGVSVTSSEIPPDYTSPAVWRGSTYYQGTC